MRQSRGAHHDDRRNPDPAARDGLQVPARGDGGQGKHGLGECELLTYADTGAGAEWQVGPRVRPLPAAVHRSGSKALGSG